MIIVTLIILSFLFMEFVAWSNHMTYFTIHDVVIHQRIPVFKNPENKYIKAVIRAHGAHHRPATPQDFKNFGLLIFPKRFFN